MAHLADALGANRARLGIIAFLHEHPGADRTAITTALGIGHQTVYSHLQALEAHGLVRTDTESAGRHGRTVHYWLETEVLRRQIQELVDALSGA